MSGITSRSRSIRRIGALGSALLAIVLVASACDPAGGRVELAIGGSTNYLGTGQLWSGADRENRWLAISGVCASREQGDRFSPISDGNFTTTNNPPSGNNAWSGCAPGTPAHVEPNPEHRSGGYVYAFEVPEAHQGSLSIQVYDAPNCATSTAGDMGGSFPVTYTLYGDEGAGSGVLASVTFAPTDTGCGTWTSIHTVADALPGRYLLQVQAVAPADLVSSGQEGSNSFALRAVSGGAWARCTSDLQRATDTTPYDDACVSISAVGGAGFLNSFASSMPTYRLPVPTRHAGEALEIELWDVGEGSERIRLLGPDLTAQEFRWTVLCTDASEPVEGTCAGEMNPTGGRSGVTDSLDVSGSNHRQPRSHRLSSSRYNDRLLRLEVDIPDELAGSPSDLSWWYLQYQVSSAPTDRTTVSAFVRSRD